MFYFLSWSFLFTAGLFVKVLLSVFSFKKEIMSSVDKLLWDVFLLMGQVHHLSLGGICIIY